MAAIWKMLSQRKRIIRTASRSRINWCFDLLGARIHRDVRLQDTIIVAGTPRGGTTWLMEIIATLPGYKSIFEPLHQGWFSKIRGIGIGPRPYLPIEQSDEALEDYLREVFEGKIAGLNPWVRFCAKRIYQRLCAKKLIVKFIRSNRLLPWMATNFKVRHMYFLVRHPCACISSQIETSIKGYNANPRGLKLKDIVLEEASTIAALRNNTMLTEQIKTVDKQEEILALIWCLDHYVPLSYPKPYPWQTVIYEELVRNGRNELQKIFGALNEKIPDGAYEKHGKASTTTLQGQQEIDTSSQLLKWKKKLNKEQINNIFRVIEWFGLDFYDPESSEPDYELMGKRFPNLMKSFPK